MEELAILIKETNELLRELIHSVETSRPHRAAGRKKALALDPLTMEDLETEIDLEWWLEFHGDAHLTAKYMNRSWCEASQASEYEFNKEELTYMYERLQDHVGKEINGHVWTFLGKVWCKAEKNARNCFAFVPVKA